MNGGRKRWRGVEERGPFAACSFHSPLDQSVLGIDRPHLTSTRLASETNHLPNICIDKTSWEPCQRWCVPWFQRLEALPSVVDYTIAQSYQGIIPFLRALGSMLYTKYVHTNLCVYYWAYQVGSLYNRLTLVGAAANWWKRNIFLFRVSMTYNNLETLAKSSVATLVLVW